MADARNLPFATRVRRAFGRNDRHSRTRDDPVGAVKDRPASYLLAICAIVVLGALLRLPDTLVPVFCDETVTTLNVRTYFRDHTIIPEIVFYPTLYSYLAAALLVPWFALLLLAGKAHTIAGVGLLLITDESLLYLPMRLLTVAFACGGIVAAYHLGKTLRDRPTGLVAASFVALSSNHLAYSSWALSDVPMACLATVSLLASLRLCLQPLQGWYLCAGAAAGAAISMKYNGGVVILPLVLSHFLAKHPNGGPLRPRAAGKLVAAGVFCIAAFLAGTPVWVIQPQRMLASFGRTSTLVTAGRIGDHPGLPYVWVLDYLWRFESTIGIVALVGVLYAMIRGRRLEWIVLSPILATVLVVGRWQVQAPHYLLQCWPALLTLGAVFLRDVTLRVSKPGVVFALTSVALASLPFTRAMTRAYAATREDNRVAAARWIQMSLPPEARIGLFGAYMPELRDVSFMENAGLSRRLKVQGGPDADIWNQFVRATNAYHLEPVQGEDLDWLRTVEPDYIILADWIADRYLPPPPPPGNRDRGEYLHRQAFYSALRSDRYENWRFCEVASFEKGSGPRIKVLRIERLPDSSGDIEASSDREALAATH